MKKTAIIFDITGVLFKENKLRLLKKIGLKRLLSYIATHRRNPFTVCFDGLQEAQQIENSTESIIYKKHMMPSCVTHCQLGLINNIDLISALHNHIDQLAERNYFISLYEKELMIRIITTILNVNYLHAISRPIAHTIKIVEQIHRKKNHRLFILSNMAHEPYQLLLQHHAAIMNLFEGIVISAQAQKIKPDPAIYNHLLNRYNLSAQECIFIDDQEENIKSAQTLGMTGILFTRPAQLKKELKKLEVLL